MARAGVRPYVGVVGAGEAADHVRRAAEEIGGELGRRGAIVVCGGLGGVMEAVCRGAGLAGGLTIGLLPRLDRREANAFVDVAIPTGIGELRNGLVVRASDALIALSGGHGTLSEIAFALKTGVPVVGLDTWDLGPSIAAAGSPREAVELALELARPRLDA